jgi:hypothetical protein
VLGYDETKYILMAVVPNTSEKRAQEFNWKKSGLRWNDKEKLEHRIEYIEISKFYSCERLSKLNS